MEAETGGQSDTRVYHQTNNLHQTDAADQTAAADQTDTSEKSDVADLSVAKQTETNDHTDIVDQSDVVAQSAVEQSEANDQTDIGDQSEEADLTDAADQTEAADETDAVNFTDVADQTDAAQTDVEGQTENEDKSADYVAHEEGLETENEEKSKRARWSAEETEILLNYYCDNLEQFKTKSRSHKTKLFESLCQDLLTDKTPNGCLLKIYALVHHYTQLILKKPKVQARKYRFFSLCVKAFGDKPKRAKRKTKHRRKANQSNSSDDDENVNYNDNIAEAAPVTFTKDECRPVKVQVLRQPVIEESFVRMLKLYKEYSPNSGLSDAEIWNRIAAETRNPDCYGLLMKFRNYTDYYNHLITNNLQDTNTEFVRIFKKIFPSKASLADESWDFSEQVRLVKHYFDLINDFHNEKIPKSVLWQEIGRSLNRRPASCKRMFEGLQDRYVQVLKQDVQLRNSDALAVLFYHILMKTSEFYEASENEELYKFSARDSYKLVDFYSKNIEKFYTSSDCMEMWEKVGNQLGKKSEACKDHFRELILAYRKYKRRRTKLDWKYWHKFAEIHKVVIPTDSSIDHSINNQKRELWDELSYRVLLTAYLEKLKDLVSPTTMVFWIEIGQLLKKCPRLCKMGYDFLKDSYNVLNSQDYKSTWQFFEMFERIKMYDKTFTLTPDLMPDKKKRLPENVLRFYLGNRTLFEDPNEKKNKLWNVLAEEIGCMPDQCKTCFRNLRNKYVDYLKKYCLNPQKAMKWQYWKLCKKVFGFQNTIRSHGLAINPPDYRTLGWKTEDVEKLLQYFSNSCRELNDNSKKNLKSLATSLKKSVRECECAFDSLQNSYIWLKQLAQPLAWPFDEMEKIYRENGVEFVDSDCEEEKKHVTDYKESFENVTIASNDAVMEGNQDEYEYLLVIPDGSTEPVKISIQPARSDVWNKRSKVLLLRAYLKYLSEHAQETISRKEVWGQISGTLGKSERSCKIMYVMLKRRHLQAVAEGDRTMYSGYLEKILDMKPRFCGRSRLEKNISLLLSY